MRHPYSLVLLLGVLACKGDDTGEDSNPDSEDSDTQETDTEETDTEVEDSDTPVDPGDPVVLIDGTFSVLLGEHTQLTARTVNAEDTAYVWASSAPAVAEVDANGLVIGRSVGTAVITATGDVSGVEGSLGLTVSVDTPYRAAWASSGHADSTAPAFNRWNSDGEVPASCARCHTASGYQDYIGADGTAANETNANHAIGQVVSCTACHNPVADNLDHVTFPSGVVVEGLGSEARCMTCHQGRSSGDTIEAQITAAAVGDDEISSALTFSNIHYYAAGATLLAGEVRGAYQYEGEVYDFRFRHAPGVQQCQECHDQHSLEVRYDTCVNCHPGVTDQTSVRNIRMLPSRGQDYNGNGNVNEGMYFEVRGLKEKLLSSIHTYTKEKATKPTCYAPDSHPYWFIDADSSGPTCDAAEVSSTTRFAEWTPRSLRAAYNYQVASKDPGSWAHNANYIIEVLHDSIQDVAAGTEAEIDTSALVRNDKGHFNGASHAARNWDSNDTVQASCSKCHGGSEGYRFYVAYGASRLVDAPDNGLDCYTCHEEFENFSVLNVANTLFPSNVRLDLPGDHSDLCATCHSGRAAKATVDANIAANTLTFANIHYKPAAATRAGRDAAVGYQYDGKTYAASWNNHPGGNGCVDCHVVTGDSHSHNIEDNFARCQICHLNADEPGDIRGNGRTADYDGDGSATEPLAGEVEGLKNRLYAAIQANATAAGKPICRASSHPYWFKDNDNDGSCSAAEAVRANQYNTFTPALLKATFNHQYAYAETGAWAHNFNYMAQLLIDSIEDVGGDTSGLTRP